ncbi:MAG: 30S ribosomal protein S19 [Planctomycetes bacterium]|jgi:small subunit ribosomal protein S19|nr:30S ribosomal protein S19 [Planctomycetota bacterium]
MSRSSRKGPYLDLKLLSKVEKQKVSGARQPIKTWARACTVVPDFIGHTFSVHNGKNFTQVFITDNMVGHKLGEFSVTRTFRGHGGEKKVKEGAAPAP